jgi:hypothetical protein
MDNDLDIRTRMNELHPDLSNLVNKLVDFGGNTVHIPYDALNKRMFYEGVLYKNKNHRNQNPSQFLRNRNPHKTLWLAI